MTTKCEREYTAKSGASSMRKKPDKSISIFLSFIFQAISVNVYNMDRINRTGQVCIQGSSLRNSPAASAQPCNYQIPIDIVG
ncbi:hypothetical protein YSY43_34460 [Paenibacillus sp. YSY-4.3]